MKNIGIYVLTFVLALALGFGIMYLVKPLLTPSEPEHVSLADTQYVSAHEAVPEEPDPEEADEIYEEEEPEPVAVREAEEVFELVTSGLKKPSVGDGLFKVYGMTVNGGSGSVRYTLSDSEGHSYESSSGVFPEVAANTSGNYTLVAKDIVTGRTARKTIYGLKYVKPVEHLEAADIAKAINSGNADNLRPLRDRMAAKVKVASNQSDVTTFEAACMRVSMEGLNATVSNLQFDGTGHLTSLRIDLQ